MFPLYLLFSVYIYGDITGNSLVFYDTRAVVTYQQGAASEYRGCFGVGKHTRVSEQAISIYITSMEIPSTCHVLGQFDRRWTGNLWAVESTAITGIKRG